MSLIKQLNKSAKNLSLQNKKIFDDIILYIRLSNIKTRDAEEFLQQMLDSLLNAQNQGVSIEIMLGTSDIKQYCEEIICTYKSSYNYLSRCSEYIMDIGIFITVLSLINYIIRNFNIITSREIHNFTFYLNFDLELIFQFLLIIPFVCSIFVFVRKSCFRVKTKYGKIKEYFLVYVLNLLLICAMVAFYMFVDEIIIFRLNIIILLIIGIVLYFIGDYLSEK